MESPKDFPHASVIKLQRGFTHELWWSTDQQNGPHAWREMNRPLSIGEIQEYYAEESKDAS